jgi:ABC-type transport system involved in multi-copper enzyme maturation permease subunit
METVKELPVLVAAELHRLRRKGVTWAAAALLVAIPVCVEALLGWAYPRDAVLPRSAGLILGSPVAVLVALTATIVCVIALGRDYELGTVRAYLSRGVTREGFAISKVLATITAVLAGGFVYAASAVVTTTIGHVLLSEAALTQSECLGAARRAVVAVAVVGLAGFVCAGVVNLALVIGRNSSMGMLAGLGYFLLDFYLCAMTAPGAGPQRYSLTCHAGLLMECWSGDQSGIAAFELLTGGGRAGPARSLVILVLLGVGFTLAAVLLFRRQDLTGTA